jgi:hypothetical protein
MLHFKIHSLLCGVYENKGMTASLTEPYEININAQAILMIAWTEHI